MQSSKKSDEESEVLLSQKSAVRLIMNDYELMFIGVGNDVLDEKMVQELNFSTVVDDYESAESYISWLRKENQKDQLYVVFERYAKRWRDAK